MGKDEKAEWRSAFDDTYATHKARLLALAIALTGDRDAAEDVVHDVFATLLKQPWRLGNGAGMMPFLVVSVRNGAFDLRRRRRRRREREKEHVERSTFSPVDPSLHAAESEEEERLLRQLSRRTWGGWTFEEIGRLQKVTKSTAHARFNQALDQLRRELSPEDRS